MVDANTAAFYDRIYREKPGKWASVDRDYFAFKALSREREREPARMLDFGCGNGHTLAFFKVQWLNIECTGVDLSPVALELASRRLPDGAFFQELPDGEWDIITVMGVAEHFGDPAAELRRIGERLAPGGMALGGLLYLEVPNCLAYSPDQTEGFRRTHEGADQEEWHWRRDTWKAFVLAAGYEIVRSYSGLSPEWQYIWVLRRAA